MKHQAAETSYGAVVVKKDALFLFKVLLVQQNNGHWGFPKGHMKKGENGIETCLREVKEETGLKIALFSGFEAESFYHPDGIHAKRVLYFLGEPVSGKEKRQKEEIAEIKWCTLEEAMHVITYDNDCDVLRRAVFYLHDWMRREANL